MTWTVRLCTAAALLLLPHAAYTQEANSSFSLPLTISGDARDVQMLDGENNLSGGFRALLSPSLQLGSHWFVYSALEAQSSSYLDYSIGVDNDRAVNFRLMQAYLGYKGEFKTATFLLKAGRLASAFGLYPLQYDDAKSPFIEPPSVYINNLPLRPDQLPCNLGDVIWQTYGDTVQFNCGGATSERYGVVPVTLYGIPGLEAQLSWNRVDARLQITNSSPANPQSLLSHSQFAQWTAGAGYSFGGGLHLGVSGYRGPYIERVLDPLLPAGKSWNEFAATGLGVDAQWSGGPWSLTGEWQRFRFDVPGFLASASTQGAYVQAKLILSPRIFAAVRSSMLRPGGATDAFGHATTQIDSHQQMQELVLGYRINRLQLLKTGISFTNRSRWSLGEGNWPQEQTVGIEIQLVTSLNLLSRGFR